MGRMILNGTAYGAGAKVEANPSSTATDELKKIDIDGTIYKIEGGDSVYFGVYPDYNSLIDTVTGGNGSATYTATEDCFVTVRFFYKNSSTALDIKVDNQLTQGSGRMYVDNSSRAMLQTFYVKKGQIVTVSGGYETNDNWIKAYKIQSGTETPYYNPVIYSTEEREVGVWIDNKPLYEKTWELNNIIVSSSWTSLGIPKGDIERIIDYKIGGVDTRNWTSSASIQANQDNNYVYAQNTRAQGGTLTVTKVTLWYTKTTDTAGSGSYNTLGVPNVHYSTDEQVIGTWLDGKPIYQKTVYVANPTISTSLVSIPNAISPNVDTTVEIIGTIDRDLASYGMTGCISYDINNTEASNVYNYVRYDKYNDTLMYKCKFDTNTAKNLIVTIKYTKTTD